MDIKSKCIKDLLTLINQNTTENCKMASIMTALSIYEDIKENAEKSGMWNQQNQQTIDGFSGKIEQQKEQLVKTNVLVNQLLLVLDNMLVENKIDIS